MADLLKAAAAADPSERIRWRDPIAAYGADAIEAVSPWVGDVRLGAFAVRVIERAAPHIGSAAPIAALRRLQSIAGSDAIARDIADSIARLGGTATKPVSEPDRFAVESIPPSAGSGWPGFQPREFEGIAGTAWRSRDGVGSLAPILVKSLRYRHPHVESHGVERAPELHLALTDRYRLGGEFESGWRAAKIIVYASGPRAEQPDARRDVVAGLYVEKGSLAEARRFGIVDDQSWDWPWFLRSLRDEHVQAELAAAMVRHGLSLGDYIGGRFGPEGDRVGFTARIEEGRLVARNRADPGVAIGFDLVADRLEQLPAENWHSVHIWRTWPADEAIEAGPAFASESLLPVLGDLFDVYLDVVLPTLRIGNGAA